jgi:hypothetical protein
MKYKYTLKSYKQNQQKQTKYKYKLKTYNQKSYKQNQLCIHMQMMLAISQKQI